MFTSIPVAKKNLRQKNIHHDGGLMTDLSSSTAILHFTLSNMICIKGQ